MLCVCESECCVHTFHQAEIDICAVDKNVIAVVIVVVVCACLLIACYDICETYTNRANRREKKRNGSTSIESYCGGFCVICHRHSHSTHSHSKQINKR